MIPFSDSEELILNSGLPTSALVEVGTDHRLAEGEPLVAMLGAVEGKERFAAPEGGNSLETEDNCGGKYTIRETC